MGVARALLSPGAIAPEERPVHLPSHPRAWLLAALVLPAGGVLAVREAVGPPASPTPRPVNARVWLAQDDGHDAPDCDRVSVTLAGVALVPEGGGPEVALGSPTGSAPRVDVLAIPSGGIVLAGAGNAPDGRYAVLRLRLDAAEIVRGGVAAPVRLDPVVVELPVDLALWARREVDLLVTLDPRELARGRARSSVQLASLSPG
jgi:hypothetical protein